VRQKARRKARCGERYKEKDETEGEKEKSIALRLTMMIIVVMITKMIIATSYPFFLSSF